MSSTFTTAEPVSSTQGAQGMMFSTYTATKPVSSTQGAQHAMFNTSSATKPVSSTQGDQELRDINYSTQGYTQHLSMYAPSSTFLTPTPMNFSYPTTASPGTFRNPMASPIFLTGTIFSLQRTTR